MIRALALPTIALLAAWAPAAAVAQPAAGAAAAAAAAVHTYVGEARACLPMPGGGALVGTGGGLLRLDDAGAITGVWTALDGLPGTRVERLVDTGEPDGSLWIGGDTGLARISFSEAGALRIVSRHDGRPGRDVLRLAETTYLASWDGGVRKLVGRTSTVVPFQGTKARATRERVSSLARAHQQLYAGTAAGLYQLRAGALVAVQLEGETVPRSIAALHGDGDTLWIASAEGLFALRGDGTLRAFGGGDLRAVTALGGELVVAGVVEGLQLVDRGRLVAFPGAPRQLTFAQALGVRGQAMCAGGLDGAWLRPATATAATATAAPAPWIRAAHRDGPPSNDISALAVDGERLWIGTFDRGVAVLERGTWRALSHPDLDGRVNAILVEPRPSRPARVWIATANGLSAVDGFAPLSAAAASSATARPASVVRIAKADGLPGRGVLALTLLADGRLLAGASYGAVIIDSRDGHGRRPLRLGPKDTAEGTVWSVAQTADGALWLGTTTGLYRGPLPAADLAGAGAEPPWQRFSLATGQLPDDWITALATRASEPNVVYAGTYSHGLVRLSPAASASASASAASSHLSVTLLRDGWINPGGLGFDGGRLLAATMDGLVSVDPAAVVAASATAATSSTATGAPRPGLPGVDVTAAVRLGRALYVSTRRGLAELR